MKSEVFAQIVIDLAQPAAFSLLRSRNAVADGSTRGPEGRNPVARGASPWNSAMVNS